MPPSPGLSAGHWIQIAVTVATGFFAVVAIYVAQSATLAVHEQRLQSIERAAERAATDDKEWRKDISKAVNDTASAVNVLTSRITGLRGSITGPDGPSVN